MSEMPPMRQQEHEGPWRKLTPDWANSANEVYERRPDGKTGEETLDELYGEGNWTYQERNPAERELEREVTRANNQIALEGLKNVIAHNTISDMLGEARKPVGDTYVDNDGNRLTGRVRNEVMNPGLGDILIGPDGDEHFENYKHQKEGE